jgi:hypothetical protein
MTPEPFKGTKKYIFVQDVKGKSLTGFTGAG